jgi:hypothetical protein
MNRCTFTQSKYFRAFCLAISVPACFAGSAQAASFSAEARLSLALPQSIPNELEIIPEAIPRPPQTFSSGSGTAIASDSFPTVTSNTVSISPTISGSTDAIEVGSAKAYSVPLAVGFQAKNLTSHPLNLQYTVSYTYNISSSVSGTGYDQSSASVHFGDTAPIDPASSVSVDDSVKGNQSKGSISNDLTLPLTLNPNEIGDVAFGGGLTGQANTVVPAPSSALSTLAFGAFGVGYLIRRQLKKQKSASGDQSIV